MAFDPQTPYNALPLQGIEQAAGWTNHKISAIRGLMDHTAEYARERLPKVYSRELIDLIFVQPYARIQSLVEAGIAKRQTASEYLKELATVGILKEVQVGREKLFVHPRFLDLLKSDEHRFSRYAPETKARRRRA